MSRRSFIGMTEAESLKVGEYAFAFLSNAADCRNAIIESKRSGHVDRVRLMRIVHEQNLDRVRRCEPVPIP